MDREPAPGGEELINLSEIICNEIMLQMLSDGKLPMAFIRWLFHIKGFKSPVGAGR